MPNPVKIVCCCLVGVSRSVGLVHSLKFHFEPVDVLPVGFGSNSTETLQMLFSWCDWFIVMESHFKPWMIERFDLKNKTYPGKEVNPEDKILVCDVGPDIWGGERRIDLLIKCRDWARDNQALMGIREKVGS